MSGARRASVRIGLTVAVVSTASTLPVDAHMVQTGFGSFYDGVAHLVLTPADLLVVVGASLLAGARGAAASRAVLFALSGAWLAGGVLGALLPTVGGQAWATTLTFGTFGLLVAFDAKLPVFAVASLAALAGLLHGVVNGVTAGPGGGVALRMAGVVATVFVLAALLAARVLVLRAAWARIVVRVAGSWIAATAILMLGWLIRGSSGP